jgi:hypothetical protein
MHTLTLKHAWCVGRHDCTSRKIFYELGEVLFSQTSTIVPDNKLKRSQKISRMISQVDIGSGNLGATFTPYRSRFQSQQHRP